MTSSAKQNQEAHYRLQPPCAGRLILTRWALTMLAFPFVWCVAMLAAVPQWIMAASGTHQLAGTRLGPLQVAHARSICWARQAAGWNTPS